MGSPDIGIVGCMQRWGFPLAALLAVTHVGAADDAWVHVARPGDTLIGIANVYLANPELWPRLRQINRIADPRRLQPGTRLRIPTELLKADPADTEVLMVNGAAARVAAGGGETALAAGALLRAGDGIRVGPGGNVTLRFADGSRLLVLENSRLTLTRAARLGSSDSYRIQVDVIEGSVDSLVKPLPSAAGQYEIRTPALKMGVRGTEFRVGADPLSQLTRSEVLAGKVRIGGQSKAITLGAGFGTLAATGQPPGAARPLAPAPELGALPTTLERVPLRFAWQASAAARGYRAQVFDAADRLVLDGVFADSAAKWADLPDGQYTLRVRAVAADGLEGVDARHGFTLKARPEPPFASAPLAKAYGEPTRFAWTRVGGAGAYHFQLAADPGFTQLIVDAPALAGDGATQTLAPGRYYWRVASIGTAADHGPFGAVQAFEQKPVPASPQASAPEIDDSQLAFRWPAGEPGQRYLLQLARAADFAEIVVERTTADPAVVLPRPAAGEYFMRVKAIDADGFAGPFGATQQLTVPGDPWWRFLPLLLLPLVL